MDGEILEEACDGWFSSQSQTWWQIRCLIFVLGTTVGSREVLWVFYIMIFLAPRAIIYLHE